MAERLDPLFRPHGIAVVGASPRGNRGSMALTNLRRLGYGGDLCVVNPGHDEVDGVPSVASLAEVPTAVDLAVVAVRAELVRGALADARAADIPAAVVVASGIGEGDGDLDADLRASFDDLAVCGPNCYGVAYAPTGAAAYTGPLVDPFPVGNVALVLQSGALTHTVTDPLVGRGVGLSAVVTTGNELSLTVADYLDWLVDDAHTHVVGIFLEGLRDLAGFVRAARRAHEAGKPVVVLASGRTPLARHAAKAHTGAVTGAAEALEGLLASVGAVSVGDLDAFRETLVLFAGGQRPTGAGLGVVSISGGGSGLVADAATVAGIDLPQPDDVTTRALAAALPDYATAANPLDATGAAADDSALLAEALRLLGSQDDLGAVAFAFNVGLASSLLRDFYRGQADVVAHAAAGLDSPTVAFTLVGGAADAQVVDRLATAHVPLLLGSAPSIGAVAAWLRWWHDPLPEPGRPADVAWPRPPGGDGLSSTEAFQLLADVGVDVAGQRVVDTADEVAAAADELGCPVVVKLEVDGLDHKTDVGGVVMDLQSAADAAHAAAELAQRHPDAAFAVQRQVPAGIEVLVGVVRDPRAGLVLSVAPGGELVELLSRAPSRPVPLDAAQARELVAATALDRLLDGYRGRLAADRDALVAAVVGISELAAGLGDRLAALEVNPLLVGPDAATAVDVLVTEVEA